MPIPLKPDPAADPRLELQKKTDIRDSIYAAHASNAQMETDTLKKKWSRIAARLRRMNKLVWLGALACLVFLIASEFVPDTIGAMSVTWLRPTLVAVFSALLGAAVVMLLFDYYDISNEFNYLKEVIIELLEMHQETDKLDRTVEAALVQGIGKGAGQADIRNIDDVVANVIKTKYGLTDSDEDVQKVDSLMEDMDKKFHEFVASI